MGLDRRYLGVALVLIKDLVKPIFLYVLSHAELVRFARRSAKFYQSIVMVKLDATCFQQRHSIVLLRPILDYDHIFHVNNLISGVWLMLLRDRVAYLNESGRTHLCDMVQPIVAHLARLELQYHEASIILGGYLSGWIITPIIRNVVLIAITIITWTH